MEISDEMRAAVLAERCERYGHVIDITQAISNDPDVHPGEHTVTVRAKQTDTIPHIHCTSCGWVWLVTADGPSYDAAEDNLNALVLPKNRRKLRRERRRERAEADRVAATEKAAAEKAEANRVAAEIAAQSTGTGTPATSTPTPAPAPAP